MKRKWLKDIFVVLVSLLLTLNIFHTLFYCFYCSLWKCNWRLGRVLYNRLNVSNIAFPFSKSNTNTNRDLHFRIIFQKILFWFCLLFFIVIFICSRFFSALYKRISTYFFHAFLFCTYVPIDLSSWLDRNWNWQKSLWLKKVDEKGICIWEWILWGEKTIIHHGQL